LHKLVSRPTNVDAWAGAALSPVGRGRRRHDPARAAACGTGTKRPGDGSGNTTVMNSTKAVGGVRSKQAAGRQDGGGVHTRRQRAPCALGATASATTGRTQRRRWLRRRVTGSRLHWAPSGTVKMSDRSSLSQLVGRAPSPRSYNNTRRCETLHPY
jgi:hypothetical protein